MKREPADFRGGHSRTRRDFIDEFAVCIDRVTFDAEFITCGRMIGHIQDD